MKGWISVPGVREHADRTLEEQLLGLAPAIKTSAGKTVLDLGCAEGVIGREFIRGGAKSVVGIEMLAEHLEIAKVACSQQIGSGQMRFICSELKTWIDAHPEPEQFDVVLALGIAHKLHQPGACLAFAARSARELVVFRSPGKKNLAWDGYIRSKHVRDENGVCHVPTVMKAHGFEEGETLPSTREEMVQYWWRR